MREIKFRAWDKKNKCLQYNVNVNDGKPVKKGYQWFNSQNTETVYHSDLEQYTGLSDKNGVEIYEGDIVIGKDREGDIFTHKVRYSFGGFEPFTHYIEGCRVDEVNCEIVGNIHKNPELLEKL